MKSFTCAVDPASALRPRARKLRDAGAPGWPAARRVKTGRTEQFNVRVKAGFKQRVEDLAAA